ncbi:MAG: glycoside hydrolase family 20 zincin-like fold domain-containing protein, partial [Actinocrinis sp.]
MAESTDAATGSGDEAALGLIPRPMRIEQAAGAWFTLDAATVIDADEPSANVAAWLRAAIGPATGHPLREARASSNKITLRIDPALHPAVHPAATAAGQPTAQEAYRLDVTPDTVTITAPSAAGLFYGAQTLRALLPSAAFRRARTESGPWRIPALTIDDRPRFGWRGALIDVARHFLPKQDLLRFIDLIALHKL